MAFVFTAGDSRAAHMRNDKALQRPAECGQHQGRHHNGEIGTGCGADCEGSSNGCADNHGGIHAEHHELALGEIDHANDAENHPQPGAKQSVHAANQHASHKALQEVFDDHGIHVSLLLLLLRDQFEISYTIKIVGSYYCQTNYINRGIYPRSLSLEPSNRVANRAKTLVACDVPASREGAAGLALRIAPANAARYTRGSSSSA